jgi:predicted nucleotidyltransferase
MHFYESSVITTTDGLHCQVYGNEHPDDKILVKPKYIPTDKISSDSLPYRFISGRKMNRLDLWTDKDKLKQYIDAFTKAYPEYIFKSPMHEKSPLFFVIPKKNIERAYSPRVGLAELMSMPNKDLDDHLRKVVDLMSFLLKNDLELKDFGVTYSTLMGHYSPNMSDINIVVYGKDKFWKLMRYLQEAKHENLKWKTYEEWEQFYKKRNRHMIHKKEVYIQNMYRKKSEGFFKETLFIIFAVENPDEVWFKWGEEKYNQMGIARFKGTVIDNKDSIVRPGCYEITDTEFIDGDESCKGLPVKKVVFYSRDYCMLAYPKEKIEASGVVEEIIPKKGEKYYRVVVGYFDAYLSKRRDEEYIRVLDD